MRLAALQLQARAAPVGTGRSAGALRTTKTSSGRLPPRRDRDVPVALVRGEHDVRGPVGPPLQRAHGAVEQVLAAVEPGEVQLGYQVVLVEDEPRAAPLQPQCRQEQQVGRVAGVDHVDRADLAGQPDRVPQRRSVLPQIAGRPSGGRAQRVAVDPHPVDLRLRLRVPLLPPGTDDVHLPARVAQRRALLPHPPVERHRQVLHQDQRAPVRPGAAGCVFERSCHQARPMYPGSARRASASGRWMRSTITGLSPWGSADKHGRVPGPDQAHLGVLEHLVDGVREQLREVRQPGLDVLAVRAEQPGEAHVGVVDPQVVPLAEEPLRQLDERALAEVVGAGFEGQPEQAHPALAGALDQLHRALQMVGVGGQHVGEDGHRDVGPLRRVDQAAQVLGQAGATEGEAGPQVGGADVQLAVGQEHVHHLVRVHARAPGTPRPARSRSRS